MSSKETPMSDENPWRKGRFVKAWWPFLCTLSFRDWFIMIVPVGWAIVCYAAVIAYGARSRAFAAITAACSGVVSTILAVDFWLSHRTTHRAPDFKPHALSVVYVKLAGAVLLFAASLAISIYFAATKTPDADLVWTSIAALMSLIWILDLIVLQRKASLEVV